MKKTKILSLAMAVCMLFNIFTAMPISAAEEGTASVTQWQSNAIVYPAQEQLIPGGPIWVKWNAVQNAVRYTVYLDDKPGETVNATSGNTMEYEVYTVDVNTHTIWIEAELANGQKVLTKPRTFYVSKKGIGFFDDLSNMQNMNLSWYYTWSTNKSNQAAVANLDFTPMFWNGQCNPNQIADYKTVLGCNEPDHTGQVNTSAATVARDWWPSFVNSGKRIGSPAAAWEYGNESGQWLYDFMELIKQPDGSYPVDFITVHNYPGWPGDTSGGDQIAGFKAQIEELWNRYHKPIWITEFAVANWPSNQDDVQSWGYTKQHVYDYMDKLIDYLDTCPYVERYAWFSFGDPDGNPYGESAGSHAALTKRTTGELTQLGQLYRDKGNPARRPVSDDAVPSSYVNQGTSENLTNVALGKTATTNRPGNGPASYGIDGDANSRFESEHGRNYELTYTVDLGADFTVSQIKIDWEAIATTATKFKLETATSENGPWTTVYTKNSGAAEQTFGTTFHAVTARYVKLTATEKEGPWGYSFMEFKVYGTGGQAAASKNIAKGKTAVSNKPGSSSASYGIDGDRNTRFESEHGGNYELTYTVDLGSTFSVDKIAILWEATTTAATKFKIETAASENGPWTTIYTKSSGDPIKDFETSFAATNARYVKLTADEKTGSWGYSFWEFEVYGR